MTDDTTVGGSPIGISSYYSHKSILLGMTITLLYTRFIVLIIAMTIKPLMSKGVYANFFICGKSLEKIIKECRHLYSQYHRHR